MMRELGTNALPWLVRQAFDHQSRLPFGSNCVAWARPQSASLGFWGRVIRTFSPPVPRLVPRIDLCEAAISSVSQLQVPAEPLLNILRPHLEGTNDLYFRVALAMLGGASADAEKVVPYVVRGLQTNDIPTQFTAMRVLEQISPSGKSAIPVLIQNLSFLPLWTLATAIAVLGNHGPDAAAAVPELEKILHSAGHPATRARAAVALCQIRGRDTEAHELIAHALLATEKNATSQNSISRDHAFMALAGVRAFATPFAELLAEAAEIERGKFGETQMSGQSVYILKRIMPEKAAGIWRDWMRNDRREFVRANAAHQLLQLQQTNQEAIEVLCGMALTNLRNRSYLISFLGEASPKSRLAVQTLERLAATNDHPSMREIARRALDQMRRRGELR